jgi:hypothetical protein
MIEGDIDSSFDSEKYTLKYLNAWLEFCEARTYRCGLTTEELRIFRATFEKIYHVVIDASAEIDKINKGE